MHVLLEIVQFYIANYNRTDDIHKHMTNSTWFRNIVICIYVYIHIMQSAI